MNSTMTLMGSHQRTSQVGTTFFDLILTSVIGIDNDSESPMSLTANIDGQVISGLAISAQAWRARLVAALEPASDQVAEDINAFLGEPFADQQAAREARRNADLPRAATRYIHMRNVHIISGNTSQKMPLGRGDLRKLTGWSLGSLNAPGEADF